MSPVEATQNLYDPASHTSAELDLLRDEFTRFLMRYKFGIDEVMTKISILREEFRHTHEYNPIEHVSSRLKSPESLVAKVQRKGCDPSFDAIRASITDIAGVRVTCSFVSDTYRVFEMLTSQHDIKIVAVKDYIAQPKANGYKSLHAILEVPVFLSDGVVPVFVEVQIRTIAMDFWASLEHKIYYKYDHAVPQDLLDGLFAAAETASRLDEDMERLHDEVRIQLDPAITPTSAIEVQTPLTPNEKVLEQFRRVRREFDID